MIGRACYYLRHEDCAGCDCICHALDSPGVRIDIVPLVEQEVLV